MVKVQSHPEGLIFKVIIQPRSSRNMVAGIFDDALKIKLTAPPVDNAANKMCVQFLSKVFKIPKSSFEILSGHTSRVKMILIRLDHNKDFQKQTQKIKLFIASLT